MKTVLHRIDRAVELLGDPALRLSFEVEADHHLPSPRIQRGQGVIQQVMDTVPSWLLGNRLDDRRLLHGSLALVMLTTVLHAFLIGDNPSGHPQEPAGQTSGVPDGLGTSGQDEENGLGCFLRVWRAESATGRSDQAAMAFAKSHEGTVIAMVAPGDQQGAIVDVRMYFSDSGHHKVLYGELAKCQEKSHRGHALNPTAWRSLTGSSRGRARPHRI